MIAYISGIVINRQFPGRVPAAGILIIAAAAFILFNLIRCRFLRLSPLVLFFGLGYLALTPWTSPRQTAYHVRHYLDKGAWQISGTICSKISDQGFRRNFLLNDLSLAPASEKSNPVAVSGRVRCLVYGTGGELHPSDRICFNGRIYSFRNFNNPGGFDYRQYMNFRGITGNTHTASGKLSVIGRENEGRASAWLQNYRSRISNLIDQAGHDPSRGVLHALILGDREQIAPEIKNAFNRAGVGHLLAISGLHIGIVALMAFLAFKWMLSLFPAVLRRAWSARGAALLAILPVVLYGVLAGMSPSTQRAVLMISVFLATFFIQREHDLLNTLAVAALIILIIDPPALFSVSFQLSFTAVLFIITGLPLVRRRLTAPAGRGQALIHIVYLFMCVSFFAILGTAPLIMAYFNQISIIGLFANLILIPLIGYLVVPLSLFSVLVLHPLWEPAARWGLSLSDRILGFSIQIIRFFSGFDLAAVRTITPSWLEIGCIYGLMGLSIWRYHYSSGITAKFGDPPAASGNPVFVPSSWRRHLPAAAGIMLAAILLSDIGYWVHRRFFDPALRVTVMNVGQGNAAVLELPGGKCVLIDGGGLSGNDAFDMGARILAPYLWRNKILHVDTVFLTHPDADHLNGLIFICEHFGVRRLISNDQAADSREYRQLLEIIRRRNISHPVYETMERSFDISGVSFEILHPPAHFLAECPDPEDLDTNNHSLVIRAGYKGRHILFPGDIYSSAESRVTAACAGSLSADVLIVPHHGSKTSCSQPFIRAVSPQAAVISAGRNNRFGFPDPVVVSRLSDYGCCIFQTGENGAVQIIIDKGKMNITPVIGEPAMLQPG